MLIYRIFPYTYICVLFCSSWMCIRKHMNMNEYVNESHVCLRVCMYICTRIFMYTRVCSCLRDCACAVCVCAGTCQPEQFTCTCTARGRCQLSIRLPLASSPLSHFIRPSPSQSLVSSYRPDVLPLLRRAGQALAVWIRVSNCWTPLCPWKSAG